MVISTLAFLFQFLPIFLLAYYATPQKYRNITLVIGSLVFYAIGSGWYTLLLLLSLLINYGLSRMISGTHARHPESAKHYLIAGLIYNFGLLVVFKYTNFLIGNLNSLLYFSYGNSPGIACDAAWHQLLHLSDHVLPDRCLHRKDASRKEYSGSGRVPLHVPAADLRSDLHVQ